MPIIESTQHKLDRIRPPRVQITYDVEIGDAIEKLELPFVMGIVADLAGSTIDGIDIKDRNFIEIDQDNFNQIMHAMGPTLDGLDDIPQVVPNDDGSAAGDGATLTVPTLKFTQMDDFSPANIVQQVPVLKALYDERQRLRDLLAKTEINANLKKQLAMITGEA